MTRLNVAFAGVIAASGPIAGCSRAQSRGETELGEPGGAAPAFHEYALRSHQEARLDGDCAVLGTRTGGSDWDAAGDLEVAKDGSVYVLGQTQSADFPTTPDAVQRKFAGPRRDVFVLKLDAAGKIVYSTLLGGFEERRAWRIRGGG